MKYCVEAWLVSLLYELPLDGRTAYGGAPPIVGCNRLVCGGCQAIVRHADHRRTPTRYREVAEVARLYALAEPEASSILADGPQAVGARAYFCRCDWSDVAAGGAKWLETVEQPWRCGGHPTVPTRGDG